MYSFSRSAQQGTSTLSQKQAELAATDILAYAQQMERAVSRAMSRGISENSLSFENNFTSGYTNADCTEDRCRVFAPAGGSIAYRPPDDAWLDSNFSSDAMYGEWRFIGRSAELQGIGSTGNMPASNDVMILLPFVKSDICRHINQAVLGTNTVAEEGGGFGSALDRFTGSFQTGNTLNSGLTDGQMAGCFCDGTGGAGCPSDYRHYFYTILLAR